MSKRAKEAALKAYPAERGHLHDRPYQREGFVKGYEQAEKDLALTWEDIRNISKILHQLEAEDWCSELIFDEAARIFNEQKEQK